MEMISVLSRMKKLPMLGFLRFPLLALSLIDGTPSATVQFDMTQSAFTAITETGD
jgi:hypothetical protein